MLYLQMTFSKQYFSYTSKRDHISTCYIIVLIRTKSAHSSASCPLQFSAVEFVKQWCHVICRTFSRHHYYGIDPNRESLTVKRELWRKMRWQQHCGWTTRKPSKSVVACAWGGFPSLIYWAFPTSPAHPRIHRSVYHLEALATHHLHHNNTIRGAHQ